MDAKNDAKDIIIQHDINTRADAMWEIITKHVNFENKLVADYGCGYGDFVWRAVDAGANLVLAFDEEQKFDIQMPYDIQIRFARKDIESLVNRRAPSKIDVALCFSVLPYLHRPRRFLEWLSDNSTIALVEAQYVPEPYNVGCDNDDDMLSGLLECGFEFAVPVGKTHVESRDVYRTIWMCT